MKLTIDWPRLGRVLWWLWMAPALPLVWVLATDPRHDLIIAVTNASYAALAAAVILLVGGNAAVVLIAAFWPGRRAGPRTPHP